MNPQLDAEAAGLLQLAVRYLDHPDVKAMPFALPTEAVAERINAYLERRKQAAIHALVDEDLEHAEYDRRRQVHVALHPLGCPFSDKFSDTAALDRIATLLDCRIWDADTISEVAEEVRNTGRPVGDSDD